jgi:hypothetical protein
MSETVEVLPPLTEEAEKHHRIWRQVNLVKRASDKIIKIGPWGIGLDGVLTWIPGVGALYSVGAGGFLIAQAFRANAKGSTIAKMGALLGVDAVSSEIPLVGDAVDFFFTAHLMAANLLQRDIEERHGAPPEVLPQDRARKPKKRRV